MLLWKSHTDKPFPATFTQSHHQERRLQLHQAKGPAGEGRRGKETEGIAVMKFVIYFLVLALCAVVWHDHWALRAARDQAWHDFNSLKKLEAETRHQLKSVPIL